MFQVNIDLGNITDWISIIINSIALFATLSLLWLTIKNISLLTSQLKSQSYHQVIEAHKTLFFPIIQNAHMAELLVGKDSDLYRKRLLCSTLINHASRIFNDFQNKINSQSELEAFKRDAADLFSIQSVNERWYEVREFHGIKFVEFIENEVLPRLDTN